MDFCLADRSTKDAHRCLSLEFPPASPSISLSQKGQYPNLSADRNGLNISDLPDNLKVHPGTLCQTSAKNPSNRGRKAQPRALARVNQSNPNRLQYPPATPTCQQPAGLEKIGIVLAESHQPVGKTDGVEGVSNSRCLRKLGSATRVLGEATYLRKFRKSDTNPFLRR